MFVTNFALLLQTGTDYGPYLANEPSPLHTTTIVDRCTEKLVDDWNKMRANVRLPAPCSTAMGCCPSSSAGGPGLQRSPDKVVQGASSVRADWCAWGQADEPLGEFMDYCTYGHMIDNVVLIVTGTLHERDVHVRPAPQQGLAFPGTCFMPSTSAAVRAFPGEGPSVCHMAAAGCQKTSSACTTSTRPAS